MTDFDPVPPPLDLPAVPDVLSPDVPLNPPMVGFASPFRHVDSENRDIILESIRTWIYRNLLPWTEAWQTQLTAWEGDAADQLDAWMVLVDEYVTAHAISGYSFRSTVTDIAPAGTTNVVLSNVDQTFRPVVVGDLVLDNSLDSNYGIVTVVLDATHATVAYVGTLRGLAGLSWRVTSTPIAGAGTTVVVLAADTVRPFSLGDLVLDTSPDGNFGIVTALGDATHVTVTFAGSLIGPQGSQGVPGAPGTNGTNGRDGLMHSVVAGENVSIDNTDPANPIITANGSFTFRNYPNLNDNVTADGNTVAPISGSIGVVFPDGSNEFIASTWVFFGGRWTAPVFYVANNLAKSFSAGFPPNWDDFIVNSVDPVTHTNLDMTAATLVEGVNGTRARWNPTAGRFAPDPSALRGNGQLDVVTPVGSVIANPDGSYSLTACTELNLNHWLPTLALEGTDEAELKISGILAANGSIRVRLSQHNNGPDTSASYGGYGRTLNYTSAGTLGYDTDFASPGPTNTSWSIASDSTNAPTMVEATLDMKNLGSPSIAAIAKLHSVFRTPDWSQVFERDWTLYNVLNVGGANPFRIPDGLDFIFSQPFTGTIRLESKFA